MRFLLVVTDPECPELDSYTALLDRGGVLLVHGGDQTRSWLIETRTLADAQAWAARCGAGPVEVRPIS